MCYSYDGLVTTNGEPLDDVLSEWKAEGVRISEKEYVDVTVELSGDDLGDLDGEMAMLSVSPASVQKLTGYMGKLMRKGLDPRKTLTEVYAADKVKTKGGNQFYPWGFRLA